MTIEIERLRQAIATMPKASRAAFDLAHCGLDYPAISVALRIDIDEVERRIADGVEHLVRAISSESP